MNLRLKFDYSTDMIYIPDGYIEDLKLFQSKFFEWLYENPDCMIYDKKGTPAYSYNATTVLDYINREVLYASREKAYFISERRSQNGKIYTITF